MIAVVLMLCLPWISRAREPLPPTPVPAAQTISVGIEGRYLLRLTGDKASTLILAATGDKPAIVGRIASQTPDGGAMLYDLRFIGRRPGRYDLRELVRYIDGSALSDKETVYVEIKGVLPADHDLHLNEMAAGSIRASRWYTALLIGVGVIWLIPVAVFVLRKLARDRSQREIVSVREPELWERLRPMLEAAARGELSIADRAKLEMLALGAWIKELQIERLPRLAMLAELREDPGAGRAVALLDAWLHKPGFDVESFRGEIWKLMPPRGQTATAAAAASASPTGTSLPGQHGAQS